MLVLKLKNNLNAKKMSTQDNEMLYDEDDAVKFIRNYLPQELKEKFSDDDINYIVDLIYEFYDTKGFLDDERQDDEDVEIDEDELVDFVVKNAIKDEVGKFEPEDIIFVVQGELGYCDSINMFD
jgi:DNA-directed RNA polymerase specialized sigma54-like protein